jgi:hypothetical protein
MELNSWFFKLFEERMFSNKTVLTAFICLSISLKMGAPSLKEY